VTETLETHAQLVGALDLPAGWVVVNRLHRRRFAPAVLERLRQPAAGVGTAERALLACVAERAAEESGWAAINAANLARLHADLGELPLIELPYLFAEEFGSAEVEQLSVMLERALTAREHGTGRRPGTRTR
jgi:hypothetical protein